MGRCMALAVASSAGRNAGGIGEVETGLGQIAETNRVGMSKLACSCPPSRVANNAAGHTRAECTEKDT